MHIGQAELKTERQASAHPPVLGGPPNYLGPKGVDVWERIMQELGATGILHAIDREMLGCYCRSYERYLEADALVTSKGLVIEEPVFKARGEVVRHRLVRNPAVSIARDELNLVRSLGALFGLDPKNRKRLETLKRRSIS